jgi:hypothetical protein
VRAALEERLKPVREKWMSVPSTDGNPTPAEAASMFGEGERMEV